MTAKDIAARLAEQTETVCRMLLPGAKQQGQYLVAGDVTGSPGDSLKVYLTGSRRGRWQDFAVNDKSQDLLDLWAQVKNIDLRTAYKEACEYLGIEKPSYTRTEPPKKKAPVVLPKEQDNKRYLDWLYQRGISEKTAKAYGCYPSEGNMIFPCLKGGVVKMWKCRPIGGKDFFSDKEPHSTLFGLDTIPPRARSIIITEGEFDAMSYCEQGIPAVSIPQGAKNHAWIENDFDLLEQFDTVYLSYDMDAPGRQGVKEVAKRLGYHRCRIVMLPEKDANECLLHGYSLQSYIDEATTIDPESLKNCGAFTDDVLDIFSGDNAAAGMETMFTEKIGRNLMFRPGEVTVWSGTNGSGKSLLMGQLCLWGIQYGYKWCIASMEMQPKRTLHRMVIQATGNRTPEEALIRKAMRFMASGLWLFTEQGTAKADKVLEVMRYAVRRYDVNQCVIDSLAKCGFDEDDYNGQKRFIDRITEDAKELNVHYHVICHPRKPGSDDHEQNKFDVRGGAALTDMVDNVLIMWRNKKKEREVNEKELIGIEPDMALRQKPDAVLLCEKQRNFTWERATPIFFNAETQQYSDKQYRDMELKGMQ
jgi:twinkle protein